MNKILHQQVRAAAEKLQLKTGKSPAPIANKPPLGDDDVALLKALFEGVQAWRSSSAGQSLLTRAPKMAAEAISRELAQVWLSEPLGVARNMLQEQAKLNLSFPVKSVSLGLVGQLDVLLFGGVVSIGYAGDIDNLNDDSVIYLGGGVTAGIEVGGDVGIEIGVWRNGVSDLQGNYVAEEIEITDDAGGVLTSYEQNERVAGITLSIDAGFNDGVAAEDYYILTFDISHGPVYQDYNAAHFLVLTTLECVNANVGTDDVYITFQPDGGTTYRYPTWGSYEMTEDEGQTGHTWGLGRSVKFNSYVDVQIQVGASDMPKIRFGYNDFSGINSSITRTAKRDGSFGNGYNEIQYKLSALLMQ